MNKNVVESYFQKLEPIPTSIKACGKPIHQLQCILFDIYGTLFISSSGDIGSTGKTFSRKQELNKLAEEFGIHLTAEQLLERIVNRINNVHQEARLKGTDFPEVDIIPIWKSVLIKDYSLPEPLIREWAIKFELIVNQVYPMPGLRNCLTYCNSKGLILGIISNAQFYTPLLFEWFLDATLNQLGFHDELLLFSYQFGIAKPDPFLFETAAKRLERLGIQRKHVLYLGNDMLKDILPAHQAGFQTALFAGDSRSMRLRKDEPQCRSLLPDMIVTDLQQLTNWF